ncbi:LysE family transporter [Nocardia sp. NPDC002869]|uniref:LysE family transporter n=1 Tax=Nocardia sp. NPDC002869 TaxID=3161032 RepID=UPI00398D58EB
MLISLPCCPPGPDFFLIAHSSMTAGWRRATGACAGIAAANAVFIATAFAGLSILRPGTITFTAVQIAGAGFLHLPRHTLPARGRGHVDPLSIAGRRRIAGTGRPPLQRPPTPLRSRPEVTPPFCLRSVRPPPS